MYFPTMSFSRFTASPTCVSVRVVCVVVWGMVLTENVLVASSTRATVRLMPSRAIEPFSMIRRRMPGVVSISYQMAVSSRVMRSTVPVPSICPETICPPNH